MAERMTIELSGERRSDGSYHIKSPSLPGFHFIVGADEKPSDFEGPLTSALLLFIEAYRKALARRASQTATAPKITRSRLNYTAELELA
jgi:hypothetical protein